MAMRPDPLQSMPPAFGEEAARQILRQGFGVESLSLNPLVGERDQNFRVDTADGQRFLFKISNPADDRPILAMQAAALRHIERVDPGLPVMRALPTAAGEPWVEVPGPDSRTYPARLFTFLPGQVTANTALTIEAIGAHGQIRARLGRALRGFSTPPPTTRSCGTSATCLSSARCLMSPKARAGLRRSGFWAGSRRGLRRRCPGCAHR